MPQLGGQNSSKFAKGKREQPRRDQKEFAAVEEREDFESRVNKQLMSSCFVFELDKIRKKTHESSILTHERLILFDEMNLQKRLNR